MFFKGKLLKGATSEVGEEKAVPTRSISLSISLLLFLTLFHLLSWVTNCLTSILDSQRQNAPLLLFLLPLLMSLSIPRMTYKRFLKLFWRFELPFPPLLLSSSRCLRRS